MAVDKKRLMDLMRFYHGWTQSPERFLEFISLVDYSIRIGNNSSTVASTPIVLVGEMREERQPGYIGPEARHLAQVMIDKLTINIHPYRDFQDVYEHERCYIYFEQCLQEVELKAKMQQEFISMLDQAGTLSEAERIDLAVAQMGAILFQRLEPYVDFLSDEN